MTDTDARTGGIAELIQLAEPISSKLSLPAVGQVFKVSRATVYRRIDEDGWLRICGIAVRVHGSERERQYVLHADLHAALVAAVKPAA